MFTQNLLHSAAIGTLLFVFTGCGSDNKPAPAAKADEPAPLPNILLITLDTVRADRLGCYGYDKPTSPNLDLFAKDAVLFENAIAQAAVTPVSHASILTGLNPYRHGLRVLHGNVGNRLDPDNVTLAEIWKKSGGSTAAFISAFPVSKAFGLDQGFDVFDANYPGGDGKGIVNEKGEVNTGKNQRRADAVTDAAIEWLNAHKATDPPMLMWVHYFDPHDPIVQPPKEFLSQFPAASKSAGDRARAIYDADICFMDTHIGRLFEAFKQRGLWDRMAVAVVADHGEGLGDHDWWSHGILYQEQIRVPMMIRVPGAKAGTRVPSLVRTVDIPPTLLEFAKVRPTFWKDMDGKSLVTMMTTGEPGEPRAAYSESVNMIEYSRFDDLPGPGRDFSQLRRDNKNDKYYCLIEGHSKLILHQIKPDKSELYDLQKDPKELANLAKSNPAEMKRLTDELLAANPLSPIVPGMTSQQFQSTLEREQADMQAKILQGLGYLAGQGATSQPSTQPTATQPKP